MDNRDARRRHTLRGALIHVNTEHKHAHGKKDRRGRIRRRKKAKNFPPKAKSYPIFSWLRRHAAMLRIRAEGGGAHIVIEGALRYCVSATDALRQPDRQDFLQCGSSVGQE